MKTPSFLVEYQTGGYYFPVTFPVSIIKIDRRYKTISYYEPQGLRTQGFADITDLSDFAQWLIEKTPGLVPA